MKYLIYCSPLSGPWNRTLMVWKSGSLRCANPEGVVSRYAYAKDKLENFSRELKIKRRLQNG